MLPKNQGAMAAPDDQGTCFGCAGRFDRSALKDVGDAFFCPGCFARLLAPVADRAPALPYAEADSDEVPLIPPRPRRVPEPEPLESAFGLCFLCMSPVGSDAFVRLRDFVICRPCSEELMREPVEVEPPPPVTKAVVEMPPRGMSRPVAPRHTPGTGTEVCTGCGRLMPGPGSYRLIDDQPFCPACAPMASSLPVPDGLPHYGATPTPALTPAVVPHGVRLCDCCVRPLVDDQFRITSGYWICLACLDSDTRLAHAVARARYRRRLERMKAQLGQDADKAGGEPDDDGDR
jgi:hypothetical protein